MNTKEFIAPIQSHLRAAAHSSQTDERAHASAIDSAAELFGLDHPPRVHPALAYSLMQGKSVDHQVCAWNVQGQAALGALTQNLVKPFELVVWMAASANEHDMKYNVLRMQGF